MEATLLVDDEDESGTVDGPDHVKEEDVDNSEIWSTVLLGAGFFFTFTAWHSTQNLQSSLTMPPGVSGTTALSVVYSLLPVGFAFGHYVVRWVGLKESILIAMGMYATFIVANMYPRWWTIYPG